MPAEESPLYLVAGDRPELTPEEILAVVLVINGGLEMSQGKIASQCFQGCLALQERASGDEWLTGLLASWQGQGWRTVVRIAETPGLFERVLNECDGIALRDEGLTEVEDGTVTLFVSYPLERGAMPKILSHKRVGLL